MYALTHVSMSHMLFLLKSGARFSGRMESDVPSALFSKQLALCCFWRC